MSSRTRAVASRAGVARRQEILDRAAELFSRTGYRATSLIHLANAIGIAKATLFHHFAAKEEILYELYRQAMSKALERMRAVDSAAADPADTVRLMVQEHALVILQNRELFTIFFDEEAGLEPAHLATIKAQQREYVEMVAAQVDRLGHAGRLRRGAHPKVVAQAILGSASWTYRWFDPARELEVDEIADTLADLAVHGLLLAAS